MTQIELLKAATPGKWSAGLIDSETGRWGVHLSSEGKCGQYIIAQIENGAPGDSLETEAVNAELLRQAKVNALLVEISKNGGSIGTAAGQSHCSSGCATWYWDGLPHEMPENIFQQVLAELDKT